ncbi:unnamed protein product [Owenia fusiformis]|uniref:Uncharacterized protein n=1 Tax=Owenia fusiformis TaxID=6347 RepID=A0A8J1UAD9_OWEFU|nr:unnamed protein product [Owenia fusiformis]
MMDSSGTCSLSSNRGGKLLPAASRTRSRSPKGMGRFCSTKAPPQCSSRSMLSKLYNRELRGNFQRHKHSRNMKLFNRIPGRLGFSLNSLVDEMLLHQGLVFLGFSKDGRFVMSYSLQMEALDHTVSPVYIYRLQWWQFVPYRPLKQISEIRLFVEDDIQQDLYVAICEWPSDNSQLLVYGYGPSSGYEEKRQCYVTITAIPPLDVCSNCQKLSNRKEDPPSGVEFAAYDTRPNKMCLQHSFAVHTKFELAPPFPFFTARTSLSIDGVAVLNTGDSLIALSVELGNKCHLEGSLLSQRDLNLKEDPFLFLPSSSDTSVPSREDSQRSYVANRLLSPGTDKENVFSTPLSPLSDCTNMREQKNNLSSKDKNLDLSSVEDDNLKSMSSPESPILQPPTPPIKDKDSIQRLNPSSPGSAGENPYLALPLGDRNNLNKYTYLSPLCLSLENGAEPSEGTCSSCVSSPLVFQNDSKCFTYSIRRYVESSHLDNTEPEDDLSLSYNSILPLEVLMGNSNHMRLATSEWDNPEGGLVVKQLTMDIEHYIGEAVRQHADWGNRYISFTDYDMQILTVCPESYSVVVIVLALVCCKSPHIKKDVNYKHHTRAPPKVYQTSFKLIWNLRTGSYETVDIEDLQEYDQRAFLRKEWHPGHSLCVSMQKQWHIPQPYATSVHVLTNQPVFKGQSLKTIVDPHHYVAIVL